MLPPCAMSMIGKRVGSNTSPVTTTSERSKRTAVSLSPCALGSQTMAIGSLEYRLNSGRGERIGGQRGPRVAHPRIRDHPRQHALARDDGCTGTPTRARQREDSVELPTLRGDEGVLRRDAVPGVGQCGVAADQLGVGAGCRSRSGWYRRSGVRSSQATHRRPDAGPLSTMTAPSSPLCTTTLTPSTVSMSTPGAICSTDTPCAEAWAADAPPPASACACARVAGSSPPAMSPSATHRPLKGNLRRSADTLTPLRTRADAPWARACSHHLRAIYRHALAVVPRSSQILAWTPARPRERRRCTGAAPPQRRSRAHEVKLAIADIGPLLHRQGSENRLQQQHSRLRGAEAIGRALGSST